MANDGKPTYWFPAKRYGWGWGAPATWQGWVVLVVWLVALLLGAWWLAPRSPNAFLLFTLVSVVVLIGICYVKGAPPRWRWGDKEQ